MISECSIWNGPLGVTIFDDGEGLKKEENDRHDRDGTHFLGFRTERIWNSLMVLALCLTSFLVRIVPQNFFLAPVEVDADQGRSFEKKKKWGKKFKDQL